MAMVGWCESCLPARSVIANRLYSSPLKSALGAGHIQRYGRADKSLECRFFNPLALVEVDGTPV
jgi:hypothetical protein